MTLYMLPSIAANYRGNAMLRDSIAICQFLLGALLVLVGLSNCLNIACCKNGSRMAFSVNMATLGDHIVNVGFGSPAAQMAWVNTGRVVARVHYKMTSWNWTIVSLINEAVNAIHLPVQLAKAIASAVVGAGPFPALAANAGFCSKAFFNWRNLTVARTASRAVNAVAVFDLIERCRKGFSAMFANPLRRGTLIHVEKLSLGTFNYSPFASRVRLV